MSFEEQIMSKDKYPSIFSRQMKAIVISAVARGGAGGARAPPVFSLKSKNRPV